MHVGVWLPNCRHLATPVIIRHTAVRAEQLGYDSVWVSDHVVVIERIDELAGCGVEHLVIEFLASDGPDLDEQMVLFAERVRSKLA